MTNKELADSMVAGFRSLVDLALKPIAAQLKSLGDRLDSVASTPGQKGEDGRDGQVGPRGADGRDAVAIQIHPSIDMERAYPRNSYASHKGGLWRAATTTDGMNGWESIVDGFVSIGIEQVSEREFKAIAELSSGARFEKAFSIPSMIYRGVWRDAEYKAGDAVTWGGSLFVAKKDTDSRPETDDTWQLAAKRGRDAK